MRIPLLFRQEASANQNCLLRFDLKGGFFMPKSIIQRRYFRTPFSRDYWYQAFSELKNTRSLVFAALILALRIAMKPLKIPIAADVNITFGFIVNSFGSMVYGPVVALLGGALSDTIGYFK